MSIRDPFYEDIKASLETARFDPELFEQFAAELVTMSTDFKAHYVQGGSDGGYDFEILDDDLEPGPGIVTTSDDVIGNLTKNLKKHRSVYPEASRKTIVVTPIVLTPQKKKNLRKRAKELKYILVAICDGTIVAECIYSRPEWAKRLLDLSGSPSALSPIPRTSRPLLNVPIVGRENVTEQLSSLKTDTLLIGAPGSGKTTLLRQLTSDGTAAFLTDPDMTAVANAVRRQRPRIIIIDDLDDVLSVTQNLKRLRAEIRADFCIAVTGWETDKRLQQLLGISDQSIIKLESLTRGDIGEIAGSMGIRGPTALLREIIDQAQGNPGLAVTLCQAAVEGNYRALLHGDLLGNLMTATINRLLREPGEGEEVVFVLGLIALSGDAGIAVDAIAESLSEGKSRLWSKLRRLAPAGIIRSLHDRISLHPATLRAYMIREAFFGDVPYDYYHFLSVVPSRGDAVVELVRCARAGVSIHDLCDLVVSSGSLEAARMFVGSGAKEAHEFLDRKPEWDMQVAREALYTAPEIIIPKLLNEATYDDRSLSLTPEHPLRILKDWANSARPGTGAAVKRKHLTVKQSLRWAEEGGDFKTAIRACACVVRTTFKWHEADPTSDMSGSLYYGFLTGQEIKELESIWKMISQAIVIHGEAPWSELLEICEELVRGRLRTKSESKAHQEFAAFLVKDLGSHAQNHPGVLLGLNVLLSELGFKKLFEVPEEFAILYSPIWGAEWEEKAKAREQQVRALANKWILGPPEKFANALSWWHEEAELAGLRPDLIDWPERLCMLIAKEIENPATWLTTLTTSKIPAHFLKPFVDRVARDNEASWEGLLQDVLRNPNLTAAALEAVIPREFSEETWSLLAPVLDRHELSITRIIQQNRPTDTTLAKLLSHKSPNVRWAASIGLGLRGDVKGLSRGLTEMWESAILDINQREQDQMSRYYLLGIFQEHTDLAARWLIKQIENEVLSVFVDEYFVTNVCKSLGKNDRLRILRRVPLAYARSALASALIGDSTDLYTRVLLDPELKKLWRAPLGRQPDSTWRNLAETALVNGIAPLDIAGASLPIRKAHWIDTESKFLKKLIDEYAPWLHDTNPGIREVAQLRIQSLSALKTEALARERHEVY